MPIPTNNPRITDPKLPKDQLGSIQRQLSVHVLCEGEIDGFPSATGTRGSAEYSRTLEKDIFLNGTQILQQSSDSSAPDNKKNFQEGGHAKNIYNSILEREKLNGMPEEVIEKARKLFEERYHNIDWKKYSNDLPFNKSALALYEWAPIAEELKKLDRKIVLNSMILKWDNIKEEFQKLINF